MFENMKNKNIPWDYKYKFKKVVFQQNLLENKHLKGYLGKSSSGGSFSSPLPSQGRFLCNVRTLCVNSVDFIYRKGSKAGRNGRRKKRRKEKIEKPYHCLCYFRQNSTLFVKPQPNPHVHFMVTPDLDKHYKILNISELTRIRTIC